MGASDLQLQHLSFDLWLRSGGDDNRVDLEKAKRYIPIVLDECVSVTQKKYIMAYFFENLNIYEIAQRYGVNPSTVSRTINRGLGNAYKYLRFVSPLFINAPAQRGRKRRQK